MLLILLLQIGTVQLHRSDDAIKLVNHINSLTNVSWKAGPSRFDGWSFDQIQKSLGVASAHIETRRQLAAKKRAQSRRLFSFRLGDSLPENFDPRDKWPFCADILSEVRDQGSCGSCWAFGAVEAMSDRICIASGGKEKVHLSAQDLVACCSSCGFGCFGGIPSMAWNYWAEHGIVTGGNYNSNEGCIPYSIPACNHHSNGSLPPCGDIVSTPKCVRKCNSNYPVSYNEDKHYGKSPIDTSCLEEDIMREIMNNGPVEAALLVYTDFLNYKSGVYHHVTGELGGGHAVKLIGWGVTPEGEKYWLAVNSWNYDWGENGFFRIRRGTDECGFESDIVFAMPKIQDDSWTMVATIQKQVLPRLKSLQLTIIATILSLILLILIISQRKKLAMANRGYQRF